LREAPGDKPNQRIALGEERGGVITSEEECVDPRIGRGGPKNRMRKKKKIGLEKKTKGSNSSGEKRISRAGKPKKRGKPAG